jgi:hypothetical protein
LRSGRAWAHAAARAAEISLVKLAKPLGFVLLGYIALVVAFECFVGFMGSRHAQRGLAPGESWVVIATRGADDAARHSVVAGVEVDGRLYVAANHWPRRWYRRALAQPDVEVTRGGEKSRYRAIAVAGEERERVARGYRLPFFLRVLAGFPPRAFLRLDPR